MTIAVSNRVRRPSICTIAALTLTLVLTVGCSEQGSAEQQDVNAPVYITNQANAILLQNQAGLPLTNIKVVVVPFGRTEFSKSIARLENTESRQVMFSEFSSRDGAVLNVGLRPKLIRVLATDVVGKTYEVEVPWQ